jgi:hypothetical protein
VKATRAIATAIGIRVHSGWGALVAVSGEAGKLQVIDRRRIVIIDVDADGVAQPYHYVEELEIDRARKHIAQCRAQSTKMAVAAMREVYSHLSHGKYRLVGAAILLSSARPLPELEKILASHAMIHAAEGEFFRQAFREACQESKISVTGIRERDLEEHAQSALGKVAPQVKQEIAGLGRSLGPPWTTDQKTAALAAAIVLAGRKV